MSKNSPRHYRERRNFTVSVQEAVQDFLASTAVKQLLPKTQKEYSYRLSVFSAWCSTHELVQDKKTKIWNVQQGMIQLHEINSQVIHCFLEHVKSTHKSSRSTSDKISSYTLRGYTTNIKTFLNWCVSDEQYTEHVQANMVQRIRKPKVEETIIEAFSQEQLDALFRACEKEESDHLRHRNKAILSLLLDTGIRASELVTLTIGQIHLDPKDQHIKVFGKGSKWGEVGFGERTRRAIQRYIRQFREPTIEHDQAFQGNLSARQEEQVRRQVLQQSRLFVSRSNKPLTVSGLEKLIERLGEWAGIESIRCSPHTFRHTFAARFMRDGGDIYRLSKLLRHSSVAVTENYLKSLRQSEARRGAKSVLDNL